MTRPDGIAQDVWDAAIKCAENVLRNLPDDYGDVTNEIVTIARAIMAAEDRAILAERERNAGKAEAVAAAIREVRTSHAPSQSAQATVIGIVEEVAHVIRKGGQ